MINLGDTAKDTATGFQGVVVSKFEYLNGCVRLQLQPQKLTRDGAVKEAPTFDIEQLVLVKTGKRQLVEPHGGPHDTPSHRATPTR